MDTAMCADFPLANDATYALSLDHKILFPYFNGKPQMHNFLGRAGLPKQNMYLMFPGIRFAQAHTTATAATDDDPHTESSVTYTDVGAYLDAIIYDQLRDKLHARKPGTTGGLNMSGVHGLPLALQEPRRYSRISALLHHLNRRQPVHSDARPATVTPSITSSAPRPSKRARTFGCNTDVSAQSVYLSDNLC